MILIMVTCTGLLSLPTYAAPCRKDNEQIIYRISEKAFNQWVQLSLITHYGKSVIVTFELTFFTQRSGVEIPCSELLYMVSTFSSTFGV